MPRRGKRVGSDATAFQEPWETVSSDTARMMPDRTTVGESVKTAVIVSPTESEVAAIAHQLWVNNGCPAGSDQQDWYRAEAMLKDARIAKCDGLSRRPPIPRCDTRTESEMLVAFRWAVRGHWEVWESEWGGARWISDEATPGVAVSTAAG
jgi:hypothetical protein